MGRTLIAFAAGGAALMLAPSPAFAETREAYLERLKVVCEVQCLKPRDFRRAARKQRDGEAKELAVMMDVLYVRRAGEKYQLMSADLERSNLETLAILGSAGIDVSGRTGAGGLPRSRDGNLTPDTIVIELDEQALADLLNTPSAQTDKPPVASDDDGIVVEGEAQPDKVKPTLASLKSRLLNRRVVVRGNFRLTPVWNGGRLDYRRKQVTLELDNSDDMVVLPRFDDDGEPIAEDIPWLADEASDVRR
ncbi:MAG: hypothetical protein AAFR32_07055 [Pseudomonadota bacterium]